MGRLNYEELVKGTIKPSRNVVVSKAYKGSDFLGYSVSEQAVMKGENGEETKVFLKHGLGIMTLSGLVSLRDTLTEVIENEQNRIVDEMKERTEK